MDIEDKNKIKEYSKKTELYLSRRKFDSEGKLIEKKCSVCKEFKLVRDYYKDKTEVDGLYNTCKSCHSNKTK